MGLAQSRRELLDPLVAYISHVDEPLVIDDEAAGELLRSRADTKVELAIFSAPAPPLRDVFPVGVKGLNASVAGVEDEHATINADIKRQRIKEGAKLLARICANSGDTAPRG